SADLAKDAVVAQAAALRHDFAPGSGREARRVAGRHPNEQQRGKDITDHARVLGVALHVFVDGRSLAALQPVCDLVRQPAHQRLQRVTFYNGNFLHGSDSRSPLSIKSCCSRKRARPYRLRAAAEVMDRAQATSSWDSPSKLRMSN